jgi:diguanylate cyclase
LHGIGDSGMAADPTEDLDPEYAINVAERAMRAMLEQSVPPTPANFLVWFDYVVGSSPMLKRTIDILIGNKRKFDAAINLELYSTHINSQSQRVSAGVPRQLVALLASAREFLSSAIAENHSHMEALSEVSSQIVPSSDPRLII